MKKKELFCRALALLLAVMMLLSICLMGVQASETDDTDLPTTPGDTTPTETQASETQPAETETPETQPTATEYGTTTFVYAGSDDETGAGLGFWVTWGTLVSDANQASGGAMAAACGVSVSASGKSATLTIDKSNLTGDKVWLNIWGSNASTTWNGVSCTFSGETYYLCDNGVSTTPPADFNPSEPDETEPQPEATAYDFTIHCYGEGYQLGAWMALVENGSETAWTDSGDSRTAAFADPEDGWTSATISWSLSATYNRLGFQIGESSPWESSKYAYDFTTPSAELWIVPGDSTVYTSKEAALEGMQTEHEPTYSITIHCKGSGYQVGAWLELVEKGEVTAWTPEDEGVTAELGNLEDGWTSVTLTWNNTGTYNRLGFYLGTKDPWKGTRYTYTFDSPTGEDVWIVPGYSTAYSTKKAALANAWSYYYQFTVHCYGEGYQLGAWMAQIVDGEEVAWTPSESSVTTTFRNLQDGWTTAVVAWKFKTNYNCLGFQIGKDSPWESAKYAYDFTERVGEVWILPDSPVVYLSEEAALEALNDPASAKYSFHVHCYGEGYQIGAWLAQVEQGQEVAWTDESMSVLGSFESEADGWSDVWVCWNPSEDYNRLGFQIDLNDPWAGEKYAYDFQKSPEEIWIVPGDAAIYLTREDAEKAMNPEEETVPPTETEPPVTEPAEEPVEENDNSGFPVIGVCIGVAVAIGLLLWLLLFLRKRKKQ